MTLISAFTIIRTISLFHLTAAYFFLAAPKTIIDQNVVFILGEAVRLPHIITMDKPSEASAFIAILLVFLGLSDLTAANMNEEVALQYWLTNVPVRVALLFVVTAYPYLFKEGGALGAKGMQRAGMGEPLQNSFVFSFGFLELAAWFWVFTSLREERRQLQQRRLGQLKAKQDSL